MSEYLSKEEIKQWRSSLERITLEEYALRLGKSIQTEKQTKDIVDIVMKSSNMSVVSYTDPKTKVERIQTIAKKAIEAEKNIFRPAKAAAEKAAKSPAKAPVKKVETKKPAKVSKIESGDSSYSFKKALTAREQMVFDYFLSNQNSIVYAKDLAKILDLPRDYVYKYIKNLRNKIEGEHLQNADNGGYLLSA